MRLYILHNCYVYICAVDVFCGLCARLYVFVCFSLSFIHVYVFLCLHALYVFCIIICVLNVLYVFFMCLYECYMCIYVYTCPFDVLIRVLYVLDVFYVYVN